MSFYGDSNEGQTVETITEVIQDALQKHRRLSALIDLLLTEEGIKTERLMRWLVVHNQNAGRIGRLLRDQQALTGTDKVDHLLEMLGPALDELSSELGIEL
jgi:hypothetical protein